MELKTTVIHPAATKRKKRRATDADDSDDGDDDLIPEGLKQIATYLRTESKKWAMMFVFFWSYSTPASLTANPTPSFEWDNVERRFASQDTMRLAQTAELYGCIPEKFHDYLRFNKDPFCKLVRRESRHLQTSFFGPLS